MAPSINDPLTLPCGVTLSNRLCKAPMTEGLADEYGRATNELVVLYRRWVEESKVGLLITGNVQIDRRYLERPGNVCIDGPQDAQQMERLNAWANAATSSTTQCWVQLSHPGRQANGDVAVSSPAPSAKPLLNKAVPVATPYEMSTEQLHAYQRKYAEAAKVCQEAGFDGIQLHAAHGYLISAFLNPAANVRTDGYGGSDLADRARFLLETVALVRKAVGPKFAIGVKLNSSDFQQAGFTHDDSIQVAQWLDETGQVDLIDLSGGNYESFSMFAGEDTVAKLTAGRPNKKESTIKREAYFMKYADDIAKVMKRTPLMVTGGFRSRSVMEGALAGGACEVIGIGRPLCIDPKSTGQLLDGTSDQLPATELEFDLPWYTKPLMLVAPGKTKALLRLASTMMAYYDGMIQMSNNKDPKQDPDLFLLLIAMGSRDSKMAKALKGLPTDDPTLRQNLPKSSINAVVVPLTLSAVLVGVAMAMVNQRGYSKN